MKITSTPMPVYATGTVNLTGGDTRVDGNGTSWLADVTPGAFLSVEALPDIFQIAEVISDVQITLTRPVPASSLTAGFVFSGANYAIGSEFTPWNNLPCPGPHSLNPIDIVNRTLLALDKLIGS